jgi:hypothetical protein
MRCVKLRFTRWHNRKHGRRGTIWEEKFGSLVVGEEERALRTMAAYIDLNPVRAGMVSDPADYRWSGYAEAMVGKARSRRGLVRIIGQMAWPKMTMEELRRAQGWSGGDTCEDRKETGAAAPGGGAGRDTRGRVCSPWGDAPFPAIVERRALVFYRALLGGQGAERKREDGTVVRRGLSEKVRERLTTPNERRLAAEILTRRVRHFTRGMIIGSRSFIDGWFDKNRDFVKGSSRTNRKRGSKPLGKPALRGLFAFRNVKFEGNS